MSFIEMLLNLQIICFESAPNYVSEELMKMGDPSSFSNVSQFNIDSVNLNIDVCFDSKVLRITTEYSVFVKENCNHLKLDTDFLLIDQVSGRQHHGDPWVQLTSSLGIRKCFRGQLLTVDLATMSLKCGRRFELKITSRTTDKCTALQWMCPAETAGERLPYLYSQCQPINCRSLFPCQDSPCCKFTYSAQLTVPQGFSAVMSAIRDDGKTKEFLGVIPSKTYYFSQVHPIPSYLMAIAVGNLSRVELGQRCAVWSEPEMMDACAFEFAEVERILEVAETICGPYIWKRFDFLVLPPSFPCGGMENPNMTFLSPTLVVGDKSLVTVLAHEIAHSWSGNLATTASWEHFWLNEGWTRFIETKIKAKLEKDENVRKFLAQSALKRMDEDFKLFQKQGKFNLTALVRDLSNSHPSDAFCSIPYEKGSRLLSYLEEFVGGPELFGPYILKYFQHFEIVPVDSQLWLDHFITCFPQKSESLKALPWEEIFFTPGSMGFNYDTSNPLSLMSDEIVRFWVQSSNDFCLQEIRGQFPKAAEFPVILKRDILEGVLENNLEWSQMKFESFTDFLGLQGSKNCELRVPWIRIGLKCGVKQVAVDAVDVLKSVGRVKYVRPLYRALYDWEQTRSTALDTFETMKNSMNPMRAKRIATDLQLEI